MKNLASEVFRRPRGKEEDGERDAAPDNRFPGTVTGARAPRLVQVALRIELARLLIASTLELASEFSVLVQLLSRIAAGHFSTRDYSADRKEQSWCRIQ
jgi:hypothetical protein